MAQWPQDKYEALNTMPSMNEILGEEIVLNGVNLGVTFSDVAEKLGAMSL